MKLSDTRKPAGHIAPSASLRLSVMMFIQYFIWGSWFVTAYPILSNFGFDGNDIKWTYSSAPIAAILSPVIVGLLADRWIASEWLLSIMHVCGGFAFLAAVLTLSGEQSSPVMFNSFIFLHVLCYMPTLALTNSITLSNVPDADKHYPRIRFFSGVGWIFAGALISFLALDASEKTFYLTVGASFIMAFYSLTLPHTPPAGRAGRFSLLKALGSDAWSLFKRHEFAVFSIGMIVLFIPVQFYFQLAPRYLQDTGYEKVAFLMSLGQFAELGFILALPFFLKRWSVRKIFIIGAAAWCLRYALFVAGTSLGFKAFDIGAILLHGICYDFCFITGMLYIDRVASPQIRAQAQGLFMTMTYGLGMIIGAQIAGITEVAFTSYASNGDILHIDWSHIWFVPALITACAAILLFVYFRPDNGNSR